MSQNSFTVTSSTGWFGRIGDSIKGVLFGLLLIVVSFPVLFFNEGRAVKTRKTLDEGAKTVITVPVDAVDAKNDGKLVYLTGGAEAEGSLSDPDFKVSAEALRLRREVEFYQWEEDSKSETENKLGGGEETVTTYTYAKDWSDTPIDSSNFNLRDGHENPKPALKDGSWDADPIILGAFTLSSALVGQIGNFTDFRADGTAELPEEMLGKKLHREGGGFYLGENPSSPTVGDMRVTHEAAMPGTVSVIARQSGQGLGPFTAKAGGTIEMLETGSQSAEGMFATAHASNKIMTWILRLVGAVLMFAGLSMVFRPLSVFADVLPIAGTMVGAGTGFIALLLTVVISFFVIAFAWIFYRPMIGIPLILVAVAGLVFLVMKLMAQKKRQAGLAPS
jgi:hypothetical protein